MCIIPQVQKMMTVQKRPHQGEQRDDHPNSSGEGERFRLR